MAQKIQIQTPEGPREYIFLPDSAAYQAALNAGEIVVGQEVIYRQYIVWVLEDFLMLVLDQVTPAGFGFPPNGAGQWTSANGGQTWTFTMGGPMT